MRTILLLLVSPIFLIAQKAAFWETKLFFEDAIGNRDSITIGHDIGSNSEYNPDYGEINIKEKSWDDVFEVRASHNEGASNHSSPKVLSKKIIGNTEGGFHPTHDCLFVKEDINFFVKIKNMPLKISWNKSNFKDFCNVKTFITPHIVGFFNPFWFLDTLGVDNPNAYCCLSSNDNYIISNFNEVNNGLFRYLLESTIDGKFDTIQGFVVNFFPKSTIYSPCSGTVNVIDASKSVNDVNVYPNPTNSTLYIEYLEPLNWLLLDLSGNKINSGNTSSIDVSTLHSGMYLLKIQVENQIIIKKILKSS